MDERQAEGIVDLVKTDLTTASPRSRRASTRSPPRPTSPRSKTVYHHALRGGRGHRRAGHGPRFLHRPVGHAGRFQPTGISACCADAPGIRRLSELEDVLGAAHAGRASLSRRRQAFAAPRTAQRLGLGSFPQNPVIPVSFARLNTYTPLRLNTYTLGQSLRLNTYTMYK